MFLPVSRIKRMAWSDAGVASSEIETYVSRPSLTNGSARCTRAHTGTGRSEKWREPGEDDHLSARPSPPAHLLSPRRSSNRRRVPNPYAEIIPPSSVGLVWARGG